MTHTSLSRTPENIDIVTRNRQFDIEEVLATNWHSDDAFRTAFFNALSILFPLGEQFFIESVKAYRNKIEDPVLQERVKGFMGQEAVHRREHQKYNEALCTSHNLNLKELEALVAKRKAFAQKHLPPIMIRVDRVEGIDECRHHGGRNVS